MTIKENFKTCDDFKKWLTSYNISGHYKDRKVRCSLCNKVYIKFRWIEDKVSLNTSCGCVRFGEWRVSNWDMFYNVIGGLEEETFINQLERI